MQYLISGVEALYPKLDRPYNWSQQENRSVPCEWNAENAERSMLLKVPYAKALPLRKAMAEAYNEKKEEKWPKFQDNFKVVEGSVKGKDAIFEIRTKLKCYDADTKVRQFDADNNMLAADFQLTSNSIVNVQVTLVPYCLPPRNGTSLRLGAVQITHLAPVKQAASPFEKTEGYTAADASPFTQEAAPAETVEEVAEGWDEEAAEVEEPKKTASKKSAPEVGGDIDDDLDAIINEWGDD